MVKNRKYQCKNSVVLAGLQSWLNLLSHADNWSTLFMREALQTQVIVISKFTSVITVRYAL